jgi:hypothetical protein
VHDDDLNMSIVAVDQVARGALAERKANFNSASSGAAVPVQIFVNGVASQPGVTIATE